MTDGEGNAKWEDRLAYDDSKLVVDLGDGMRFVKVADEVPSWASIDASTKVWVSNGTSGTVPPENNTDIGNGSFVVGNSVAITTTDNLEFNSIVFPEKGVYFVYSPGQYISGIASADSDTPEITWDGNIGVIKKLDEKFLPDQPVFYPGSKGYLLDAEEGAYITLEQAKAVGLNFIIQTDYGIARPISAVYDDIIASFYVAESSSTGGFSFTTYRAGEQK